MKHHLSPFALLALLVVIIITIATNGVKAHFELDSHQLIGKLTKTILAECGTPVIRNASVLSDVTDPITELDSGSVWNTDFTCQDTDSSNINVGPTVFFFTFSRNITVSPNNESLSVANPAMCPHMGNKSQTAQSLNNDVTEPAAPPAGSYFSRMFADFGKSLFPAFIRLITGVVVLILAALHLLHHRDRSVLVFTCIFLASLLIIPMMSAEASCIGKRFLGRWYYFTSSTHTWDQCRDECASHGWVLTSILSEAENNWLSSALPTENYYWIGGYSTYDIFSASSYKWVETGTSISSNYFPGFSGGASTGSLYLRMTKPGSGWVRTPGSTPYRCVCSSNFASTTPPVSSPFSGDTLFQSFHSQCSAAPIANSDRFARVSIESQTSLSRSKESVPLIASCTLLSGVKGAASSSWTWSNSSGLHSQPFTTGTSCTSSTPFCKWKTGTTVGGTAGPICLRLCKSADGWEATSTCTSTYTPPTSLSLLQLCAADQSQTNNYHHPGSSSTLQSALTSSSSFLPTETFANSNKFLVQNTHNTYYDGSKFATRRFAFTPSGISWSLIWNENSNGEIFAAVNVTHRWWMVFGNSGTIFKLDVINDVVTTITTSIDHHKNPEFFARERIIVVYDKDVTLCYGLDGSQDIVEIYRRSEKVLSVQFLASPARVVFAFSNKIHVAHYSISSSSFNLFVLGGHDIDKSSQLRQRHSGIRVAPSLRDNNIVQFYFLEWNLYPVLYEAEKFNNTNSSVQSFCYKVCGAIGYNESSVTSCLFSNDTLSENENTLQLTDDFQSLHEISGSTTVLTVSCIGGTLRSNTGDVDEDSDDYLWPPLGDYIENLPLTQALMLHGDKYFNPHQSNTSSGLLLLNSSSDNDLEFINVSTWVVDESDAESTLIGIAAKVGSSSSTACGSSFAICTHCSLSSNCTDLLGFGDQKAFSETEDLTKCTILITATINVSDSTGHHTIVSSSTFRAVDEENVDWMPYTEKMNISDKLRVIWPSVSLLSSPTANANHNFDVGTRYIDNVDSPVRAVNYTLPRYSSSPVPHDLPLPFYYSTVQEDAVRFMRRTEEADVAGIAAKVRYAVLVKTADYGEKLSVLRCGEPAEVIISIMDWNSRWQNRTVGLLPRFLSFPSLNSYSFEPSQGTSATFSTSFSTVSIFPSPCSNYSRLNLVLNFAEASGPLRIPFILVPNGWSLPDEYPGSTVPVTTTPAPPTTSTTTTVTSGPPTTTSTSTTTTSTTTTLAPTCPPGTFYHSLDDSCVDCPEGTYGSESNSTLCAPCPPGTSSNAVRATSRSVCKMCPAGSFSQQQSATCQLCGQGSYQSESNSSSCLRAPRGKYVAVVGATSPSSCPAGTSTLVEGASSEADCQACQKGRFSTSGRACQNCSTGTYCAFDQCASCTPCSPGYEAPSNASLSCVPCPVNFYSSLVGSANCAPCPADFHTAGQVAQSVCSPVPPTTTKPYLTQIPPVVTYESMPSLVDAFDSPTTATTQFQTTAEPGGTLPPAPLGAEVQSQSSVTGVVGVLQGAENQPQDSPAKAVPPYSVTFSIADVSLGSFIARPWLNNPDVVISSPSQSINYEMTLTSSSAVALAAAVKNDVIIFNPSPQAISRNFTMEGSFLKMAVKDGSNSPTSSGFASLSLSALPFNDGPQPQRISNQTKQAERILVNVSRGVKFDVLIGVVSYHPQSLPLKVAVQQFDGAPLPSTMRVNCKVESSTLNERQNVVNCSAVGTLSQEAPLFTQVLVSDDYIIRPISVVFVTQSIPLQPSTLNVPVVFFRPGQEFVYELPPGMFVSSTEIRYAEMQRGAAAGATGGFPLPTTMSFTPNTLRGRWNTPGLLVLQVVAEDLFSRLARNITFNFTNIGPQCSNFSFSSAASNNSTPNQSATPPSTTSSSSSVFDPVPALRPFEQKADLSTICEDPDDDKLFYTIASLPFWLRADIRSSSTLTVSGSPPIESGWTGEVANIELHVTDSFITSGAVVTNIPLRVIRNTPPINIKPLPEILVTPGDSSTTVLLVSDYFQDPQSDHMLASATLKAGTTAPWLKLAASTSQPATITVEADIEDNDENDDGETTIVEVAVRDALQNVSTTQPVTKMKVTISLTAWQKARRWVTVAASALGSVLAVVSMYWVVPFLLNVIRRRKVVIECPLTHQNPDFNFPVDTRECLFQVRAPRWYTKALVCFPKYVREEYELMPTSDGSPPSWLKVEDSQVKLDIPNDPKFEPRIPVITFRFFSQFGFLLCQFDADYKEITKDWPFNEFGDDAEGHVSPKQLAQVQQKITQKIDNRVREEAKKTTQSVRQEASGLRNLLQSLLNNHPPPNHASSSSGLFDPFAPDEDIEIEMTNNDNTTGTTSGEYNHQHVVDQFDVGDDEYNAEADYDDDDELMDLNNVLANLGEDTTDDELGKAEFSSASGKYKTHEYDTELEVLLDANSPNKDNKKGMAGELLDTNPIHRLRAGTVVKPSTTNDHTM